MNSEKKWEMPVSRAKKNDGTLKKWKKKKENYV